MQLKLFSQLFSDSVHGGALKIFALLARLAFLIVIIPSLASGELASYVFINSMSVIVAILAIMGLNEDLPRVVAGDIEKTRPFLFWFPAIQCLLALSIGIFLLSRSMIGACVILSIALFSGRYVVGLVRSIDARIAERQSNIPWIIFLTVTLALGLDTSLDLILTMAIALTVVQWYAYFYMRQRLTPETITNRISLKGLIHHGLQHGLSRMLSTICLIGAVRGFVLWPVWLDLPYDIDQIAFAITASAIVTEFGQIPVFRSYARWCRTKDFSTSQVRQALQNGIAIFVVLMTLSTTGVYLIKYLGFMPPQFHSTAILLQAIAAAALLPTFHLLRYLSLSKNIMLSWLTIMALTLFLAAGLTTIIFPIEYWFAVAWTLLATACAITAIKLFNMAANHSAE